MKQNIEQKNKAPASAGNTNTDGRKNETIELRTDDVEAFTEICRRIRYTARITEIDSSMVEAFVDVDAENRKILIEYAYMQGLRYGIMDALKELNNKGVLFINNTTWQTACNKKNCEHFTHYAEEPVAVSITIRKTIMWSKWYETPICISEVNNPVITIAWRVDTEKHKAELTSIFYNDSITKEDRDDIEVINEWEWEHIDYTPKIAILDYLKELLFKCNIDMKDIKIYPRFVRKWIEKYEGD